jgi:hypothetical protein
VNGKHFFCFIHVHLTNHNDLAIYLTIGMYLVFLSPYAHPSFIAITFTKAYDGLWSSIIAHRQRILFSSRYAYFLLSAACVSMVLQRV